MRPFKCQHCHRPFRRKILLDKHLSRGACASRALLPQPRALLSLSPPIATTAATPCSFTRSDEAGAVKSEEQPRGLAETAGPTPDLLQQMVFQIIKSRSPTLAR